MGRGHECYGEGCPSQFDSTGRRIANHRRKRLIAFGWYGGKFSHLDFLAPLFPTDAEHFCDVFGGSAAVVMNIGPYPIETYNDIDSEIVNFFSTLRNQQGKLVKAISLTPFSREELGIACMPMAGLSRLERARRFLSAHGRHALVWRKRAVKGDGRTAF